MQRLSTGMQINGSADNPAGLVVSQLQQKQINGLSGAISNIDRGVNEVQTADSALGEVGHLLNKMRSLAVDSANSATNDTASLSANQAELGKLAASIDSIANTTKFGTKNLLDGTFTSQQFQIGAQSGENTTLTIAKSDSTTLAVNALDLTTASGSNAALTAIDSAISTVASARGDLGAFQVGTLEATKSNNQSQLLNMQQAQSSLQDTDYQKEIASFTSEQIRQQVGSTVLGMANQSSQSIISLLRG
jgi:flagellin